MPSDPLDVEAPTELPTAAPTERASGSPPPAGAVPRRLEVGDVVGRYEIRGTLGQGGMGVVYEAEDPQLRRTIALKLLHPGLSGGSSDGDDARARLRREAQAMAQVAHPNVVTVTDVGEHEGDIYIAMERIQGTTLREWLRERARTTEEILAVFADAASGLEAVHAADLVHRDFKPDNVMVAGSRVVVMDLGLARAEVGRATTEGSDESLTDEPNATRGVAGTPGYIAPEQFAGRVADPRSDQFAFAVSLYEALCGTRPFKGKSLPELVLAMEVEGPRPPPADARVPAPVLRALRRGLAREPAERFESVTALMRAAAPRRRRWLPWAGFVTLVAGGFVVAAVWPSAESVAPCASPGSAREGSWDARAREAVEAGLTALGPSWQAVARESPGRLDDWVSRWDVAYAGACDLADPDERDAAMFCLRRRLARFDGLVEGLSHVDAAAAEGAVAALLDLPDPGSCTEASLVELSREQRGLLLRVERATTALTAGDPEPAQAIIGEVDLDHVDPRVAHGVERLYAMVEVRRGDAAAAATRFESAYLRARAAGLDAEAIEMATWITISAAYDSRDPERSRWWRREVEALMSSSEMTPQREVMALVAVGAGLVREGEHDAALPRLSRAVALAEEHLPAVDLLRARAYNHLGGAQFELGHAKEALAAYEKALEGFTGIYGRDQLQPAQLESNMGNALAQLGRLDEAMRRHDHALEVLERTLGAKHPQTAFARLNRAEVLPRVGRRTEAIEQANLAIDAFIANYGEDHGIVSFARETLATMEAPSDSPPGESP